MDHDPELLKVLFPSLSQVLVERVDRVGRTVRIAARCVAATARCPGCGTASRRVHSRYVRRPVEIAVGGQETAIHLVVRRFFCDEAACEKKTSAEQADQLTFRYGRRTVQLQRIVEHVASALGGQAGQRLPAHLPVAVSGSTLLRQIRRLALPPVPEIEVVGVDEFALRRGRRFGAVVLDMASHRPVDVLPDHTSDTFASWLRKHPHVRLVCRDRGSAFADGANRALPGIPQIADRRHILDNLATAVEKAIRRHRPCLTPPTPRPPAPSTEPVETRAQQHTRARWQEIRTLYQKGITINAISGRLGLDRKTIRRYAHATSAEELIQPRRCSELTGFKAYLAARWAEGCNNAQALREEIGARGYQGSRKSVRRSLNSLDNQQARPADPPPPPAVAHVVRWIIGRPENQSESGHQRLKDLCERCDDIAATHQLARDFATLLRQREGHRPTAWLAQAEQSEVKELHAFAGGIRKGLAAVTAGLTQHWNSGPLSKGHGGSLRYQTAMRRMRSPQSLRMSSISEVSMATGPGWRSAASATVASMAYV